MSLNQIKTVAVVGAGLMGHGIAQVFAQAGYKVLLNDVNKTLLDNALSSIESDLKKFTQYGLLSESEAKAALSNICPILDLKEAGRGADFVVEAVTENVDVKRSVFTTLDQSAPQHTILASNTSGIPITLLASATNRPDKVVGTHFWNPPTLLQAVEIVRGEKTSDATIQTAKALLEKVGKKPVVVNKDIPGQIGIRILYAIIREATSLVEKGVATPEDIDTVIKETLGTRFPVLGVFDLVDLSGVNILYAVSKIVYKDLDNSTEPHNIVKQMVERNEFGVKTGKGFYDWSKRSASEVMKLRDEYLIKILRERKTR
ncbi:MAG: 3-hydroxyacyl-CoA dehydrogenase family protein [Nitrososphaerales archaeon]